MMMNQRNRKLPALLGVLLLYGMNGARAAEQVLPEVQVSAAQEREGSAESGYRTDTVTTGVFGKQSLQDVPLSVQGVSGELIRNTQASNTAEALKYVPTVYASTGAGQITPYFSLRGFSASTWTYNVAVDGMRSFDIWQPMEDKAGIEVLTGASGFLYGVTSAAGTINYITKRSTPTPLVEATVGSYDEQIYGHLDLGGPAAGRSDLAYRLNLGWANAGDTGTEGFTQERYSLSGVLDWRFSPDTLLSFEAARARRDIDQPQALFVPNAASGIPAAPDARNNWGPEEGDTRDVTSRIGLGLDSRLNDVFTLRAKVRYSDDERRYLMGRQMWQNAGLDYRWRLDAHDNHHRTAWQYALFLDAALRTGALAHTLTLGATRDDFHQGWNGYCTLTTAAAPASWYPGNLHGIAPAPGLTPVDSAEQQQDTTYTTWILSDRIAVGERWELLLGGNLARVDDRQENRAVNGAVTAVDYDAQKFTPAAALTFKPLPQVSVYAAYTEALEQGFKSTAPGNYGETFAPYASEQKEVGVKAGIGGMQLSAAWFRIDKANQMVENNIASQDGFAVHQGWEFFMNGKATDNLTLVGGFTWLDATVERAAGGLNEGMTPQGVPEKMAKIYAEYQLPLAPGLTVTGGLSHVGKAPVDAANTLYVDAVTLGDLGLRYQHRLYGKNATWRFNVANIGGKDYWATRSGMLYLGAPRTLSLSATLGL